MTGARIAVVTGATSGIGAATTRLLARNGFRVIATGRRADRLEAFAAEAPEEVEPVPGDVTHGGLIAELFEAARRRWQGEPDTVVLCAGHGLRGTLIGSDESLWGELFETNYLAVARQLRAFATVFLRTRNEEAKQPVHDIVVIGSTAGRQVSALNPVYGSTKFAVHSLVESLRQEVCQSGIRVTLIEPGFVKSEFQARAGYDPAWFGALEAESGPFLTPEDVARTVHFIVCQPPHVHLDDVRIRPTRQKI